MGMHQRSVLLTILYAVVVDVVTEFARYGLLSEWQYTDDRASQELVLGIEGSF